MTPLKTLIEEEKKIYWEKVHDVQNEIDWGKEEDSPIHEFGLKTIRNDELFTVVDWKNIESHLISAIQRAYEAGEKKGQEEERESIEAIFKKYVPPHAMGLEDSVWLKRVLNKAFGHENIH